MYTVNRIHSIHCTVYTVHVQCTAQVYTGYRVQSTLYTVHCTLCDVLCTLMPASGVLSLDLRFGLVDGQASRRTLSRWYLGYGMRFDRRLIRHVSPQCVFECFLYKNLSTNGYQSLCLYSNYVFTKLNLKGARWSNPRTETKFNKG